MTSDTLSLITEVHKHIAGGQDIVPGISFRLKTSQNVGDFAIYIRDTLNDSKQHTTLLYTGLQEHFLVEGNLYCMSLIEDFQCKWLLH